VLGIQAHPWLAFAAPVKKADRTRMKRSAAAFKVVATQAMLIPSMVDGLNLASKHQKKRR